MQLQYVAGLRCTTLNAARNKEGYLLLYQRHAIRGVSQWEGQYLDDIRQRRDGIALTLTLMLLTLTTLICTTVLNVCRLLCIGKFQESLTACSRWKWVHTNNMAGLYVFCQTVHHVSSMWAPLNIVSSHRTSCELRHTSCELHVNSITHHMSPIRHQVSSSSIRHGQLP